MDELKLDFQVNLLQNVVKEKDKSIANMGKKIDELIKENEEQRRYIESIASDKANNLAEKQIKDYQEEIRTLKKKNKELEKEASKRKRDYINEEKIFALSKKVKEYKKEIDYLKVESNSNKKRWELAKKKQQELQIKYTNMIEDYTTIINNQIDIALELQQKIEELEKRGK